MPLPTAAPAVGAGPRIGTVTSTDGPLVEVPSLRVGYSYGPARVADRFAAPAPTEPAGAHAHTTAAGVTGTTTVGTDPAHDHTIPATTTSTVTDHTHPLTARPLAVGDEVLVVFLGDSRTELVIVDRLLPVSTPPPP